MDVANIFSLIGFDENALTKSFAFILHHNKKAMREFLKLLDLKHLSRKDLNNAKVTVQVVSEARPDITDLEIDLPDKFAIIIESKVGDRHPDMDQLKRYAERLLKKTAREKRLVLLSQIDERKWYEGCFDSEKRFCGLTGEEYIYYRWDQIHDLMFQCLRLSQGINHLNKMFLEYLEGMFMPNELLVIATNSQQEFDILKNHGFYRYPVKRYPREKALYLAVYFKGIEHIAKIKEYKVIKGKDLPPLPQFHSDLYEGDRQRDDDYYQVFVGQLIKLPYKITNPQRHRIGRGRYTSFEKLLSAKYIHEL